LKNGHTELAHLVRGNWMRTNERIYAATGKMMEKYNVADPDAKAGGGEYPNQDGFGWTNGVYTKMRG
jgi:alpha,alpha-trehalase